MNKLYIELLLAILKGVALLVGKVTDKEILKAYDKYVLNTIKMAEEALEDDRG